MLEDHGLVRVEVEEGVSVAPPGPTVSYAVLASLNFSTLKALEGAMAAHGAQLSADFANFTNVQPQLQVNEVIR